LQTFGVQFSVVHRQVSFAVLSSKRGCRPHRHAALRERDGPKCTMNARIWYQPPCFLHTLASRPALTGCFLQMDLPKNMRPEALVSLSGTCRACVDHAEPDQPMQSLCSLTQYVSRIILFCRPSGTDSGSSLDLENDG